ncbi:uncharacterized protein LOC143975427 [Lithobates pipiens]
MQAMAPAQIRTLDCWNVGVQKPQGEAKIGFDELLGLISPRLEHQNTCYRTSIQPAESLLITLRYLATGNSFGSLHYEFKVGKSTISGIINETCLVMWEELKDLVMKKPKKKK